jgi:hypothetical protein
LLAGRDADVALVYALGGPAAGSVFGPHPRRDQRYWLRVWAARAQLGEALPAVASLQHDDPVPRVRAAAARATAVLTAAGA